MDKIEEEGVRDDMETSVFGNWVKINLILQYREQTRTTGLTLKMKHSFWKC